MVLHHSRYSSIDEWQIQDFLQWDANPKEGMPMYYVAKVSQELHENEENWTKRGACVKNFTT